MLLTAQPEGARATLRVMGEPVRYEAQSYTRFRYGTTCTLSLATLRRVWLNWPTPHS